MHARVTLILAIVLGAATASCKSCDPKPDDGGADGGHARPKSLTPEQAKKPLAQVGDETITLGDYTAALEHMDQFDRLRYQSTERRKELLDEMITVKLLAKEAQAKGYDKDPLSQQELRAILRDAMLAEARKDVPSPTEIPEAEVRAFFEQQRADYKDPERRRVSAIALKDEASAKEVLASALKVSGPTQWGELVRAKSIDAHARDNVPVDLAGDLGIVSPPGDARGENGRVPEEVRKAAFAIKDAGTVHDAVVPSGGRFFVVRLTQKLPPHDRTFEEAERTIRVKLSQDRLRAKEDQLIAELRKSVKVEVDESALATVKVPAAAADAGR